MTPAVKGLQVTWRPAPLTALPDTPWRQLSAVAGQVRPEGGFRDAAGASPTTGTGDIHPSIPTPGTVRICNDSQPNSCGVTQGIASKGAALQLRTQRKAL